MKLEVKDNCPLNAFKPCKKLNCAWFMQIQGTDPNTGEKLNDWGCAMAWLPKLMIENAMHTRHTGSAVESFRNEMVKGNQDFLQMITATKNHDNLIEVKDEEQSDE